MILGLDPETKHFYLSRKTDRQILLFTITGGYSKQQKDFMEQQQQGFSDSTPRAGSDRLQKSAKSLLSALQLMSISQISTQKYGSGHFDPF